MREFCTLASELRVQTGPLDASNIYYSFPEYFRPSQQDASELFQYIMDICPLFQAFFTGIGTQTQHYSQCRQCNLESLPFTIRVLHATKTAFIVAWHRCATAVNGETNLPRKGEDFSITPQLPHTSTRMWAIMVGSVAGQNLNDSFAAPQLG